MEVDFNCERKLESYIKKVLEMVVVDAIIFTPSGLMKGVDL